MPTLHELVFLSSMKQAYYTSPVVDFLIALPQTVLGPLAAAHAHDLDPLQRSRAMVPEPIRLGQSILFARRARLQSARPASRTRLSPLD